MTKQDKPLYLWKVDKNSYKLFYETYTSYTIIYRLNQHMFVFDDKNKHTTHHFLEKNLDKYSQGQLLSFSNDREYVLNIIQKQLFKKYYDSQTIFQKAEKDYIGFRTANSPEAYEKELKSMRHKIKAKGILLDKEQKGDN